MKNLKFKNRYKNEKNNTLKLTSKMKKKNNILKIHDFRNT
jgi:hypothetical protein